MQRSLSDLAGTKEFLNQQLPEIATNFAVQWVAVFSRSPEWETVGQWGRHNVEELPFRALEDVLDRESALFLSGVAGSGGPAWNLLVVPLSSERVANHLLILGGTSLSVDSLPGGLLVGRALVSCLAVCAEQDCAMRRSQRLGSVLEIATSIARVRETQPLLEQIASEATQLLDCDRASIFIWDRDHEQLVACPALGVEGGTLRVSDKAGLVGEALHTGRTIRVDDTYRDPRFNQQVDKDSGYKTNNLICEPLRNAEGQLIGVFQVINKARGSFDEEDVESLRQLSRQAAIAIQNTREREDLIRSREQLTERVTQGVRVIGDSPAIEAMRNTIQRLAATDLPVLILGESGTGKEVVSQSLHYQGPRSERPFIAVNCAALTESLLESELFGHEKGAFTDAHDTRQGKFELAEGGTLFLDEIGDMSLGGQAKLLRVLEQKVVTRVGGSQAIPINVRVIAATNANLGESVREKKFREDLFYRLSVVTLDLPPLRERPEDIIQLSEHFLEQFCADAGRRTLGISPEARKRLQAHAWPGNVRELRNLMERVAFLAGEDRVEVDDLAFILSPGDDSPFEPTADMGLTDATKHFQREYIRRAIKRVKGNMSEAARLMGLHRSNLYRKMRHLNMKEAGDEE